MSADDAIYRVQFKTEQHYYDLYVRHVFPADLGGFMCLDGFLFHEETQDIFYGVQGLWKRKLMPGY